MKSGMALKKLELTPESGNVDRPYYSMLLDFRAHYVEGGGCQISILYNNIIYYRDKCYVILKSIT